MLQVRATSYSVWACDHVPGLNLVVRLLTSWVLLPCPVCPSSTVSSST